MKKFTLLLIIAFAFGTNGFAQHITPDKVPGIVGKAFRTKFPAASQDSWNMLDAHTYQVVFFNARKKQSANFDDTGKWLQSETEMDMKQVPSAVMRKLNKDFGDFNIQEVDLLEMPEGANYEITAVKGSAGYELLFSAKGELLRKEAAKAEKDE